MKIFFIVSTAIVFVGLLALIAYKLMGGDPVDEGSTDSLLGVDRMGDASDMVTQLVISVIVAVILGGLFLIFVLPKASEAFANLLYDQTPEHLGEPTLVDQGRSLKLQQKYEEAIEMFRTALEEPEPNREAWVEIASIQEEQFEDPTLALQTLREGWEAGEWEMSDDVNFIHRIATIEEESFENVSAAKELYQTIIERYPESEYELKRAELELARLFS